MVTHVQTLLHIYDQQPCNQGGIKIINCGLLGKFYDKYSSMTCFAIAIYHYRETRQFCLFFLKFKAAKLKLIFYFTHLVTVPSLSIIVTNTDGVRRVARILLLLKPILMVSFPSDISSSMI